MRLILDLTEEETNKLTDVLTEHQDEGPQGAGWSSLELNSLSDKVAEAIKKHDD